MGLRILPTCIILAMLFACVRAADGLDTFSNHLFGDLGPILALFGERVTMQFMSQAMDWVDCIALAMAPIGIITILISAIRVSGPQCLKAIIGRARESTAAAEMELMSSTSKEVCELFNGNSFVRCQGTAPVWEYICIIPKKANSREKRPLQFMTLGDAVDEGLLSKHEKGTQPDDTSESTSTPPNIGNKTHGIWGNAAILSK
ncbi:unnamed protein product [Clonostachys rhizophaga]|uniref:Uncharacterized protein n=1 Tax=Clonostachys rhizophaga TaxID=160324 RepID=A0A9N9W0V1_9HYPO|nr:unnamed protein product [Clonostachys rhizophaga]